MSWYYWNDEQRVPVGPFSENELLNLVSNRVIGADTRVAQTGGQDWRPLVEVFPQASQTQAAVSDSRQPGNDARPGKLPTAELMRRVGVGLARAQRAFVTATKGRRRAVLVVLLLVAAGFKINAKIEREREGREYRERVIAERARTSPKDIYEYMASRTKVCPQCSGSGMVKRTYFPSPMSGYQTGPEACESCFGRGTFMTPSGIQSKCEDCGGRGVRPMMQCGQCGGTGTVVK